MRCRRAKGRGRVVQPPQPRTTTTHSARRILSADENVALSLRNFPTWAGSARTVSVALTGAFPACCPGTLPSNNAAAATTIAVVATISHCVIRSWKITGRREPLPPPHTATPSKSSPLERASSILSHQTPHPHSRRTSVE